MAGSKTADKADDFPVPESDDLKAERAAEDKAKSGPPKGTEAAKESGRKGGQTRAANARARELSERIERVIAKGGATVGEAAPNYAILPGLYLVDTADEAGSIFSELARNNPKVAAFFERSDTGINYVDAVFWVVGLGVAIALQFGLLSPSSPIAVQFGLDKLYSQAEATIAERNARAEARRGSEDQVEGGEEEEETHGPIARDDRNRPATILD